VSALAARPSPRRAASPYARRLARERGIPLEQLRGSGPGGRIVAADLDGYAAKAQSAPTAVTLSLSALATTIQLETMQTLLAGFAAAETAFTLEDVALRAAGCALDDIPAAAPSEGMPVALETDGRQLVFADIRKGSLAPLRDRRLAALAGSDDDVSAPADLSLRLLPAGDIRPVLMPLLAGRAMRLVIAVGDKSGEALLSFDAAVVSEEAATAFLSRFKAYLEQPLRLLA
jgi:pyruvate/2-oxoglutarate dehydrogenase complex dihydrolipoamide acyltransferase (E2) component